ncbi:HEAT repeat domain-containing protein [Anabaena sp. CCY 9402-a]|uniref:HEAT repeat domain-containing protein n=1 Tax=Anabaena sp. CCY 9402-a TaxID=3103867 RepID=UPI0039C652C6
MINWNDYLQSLCNDYAQWWNAYTLTDVVGQQRVEQKQSPLLLDFMVQTVQSGKEERNAEQEKVERLDVLAGLRKYAQEHVLLVGRPGSGKSTALARLLLEEAEKPLPQPLPDAERGANSPPSLPSARCANVGEGVGGLGQIPILVELRYYQTSVLDLIRGFLMRHRLLLETATIEQLLFDGEFLLLVDGINELPSEKARQDLSKFRQDYQKTTPMIFTTRDLGVGGDLGITKKLEMQPLTTEQMQGFVRAYLPEQGEQMLQHLGDRLREFGETPLLLWMLCSLFQATGDIPPNLGLVFRQFTQSYERKFRQGIPVADDSWRNWFALLKHLAFSMTKGDKLTELNVAIPRLEAEEVLTQFLRDEQFDKPRDRALNWLQDLLNHHLIQLGANNQIEFRHQLIQEYYTAECLLKQLPSLSDDCLQREYLNYLKWTEPLKLMLELVDDGAQAVRVVNLALEVDWQLGAKLAGAVKPELQPQTVDLVARLEVSKQLINYLLSNTRSISAVSYLLKTLYDQDPDVCKSAAESLGEIASDTAIPKLIEALENEVSDVRASIITSLGRIRSNVVVSELLKILINKNENYNVRLSAGLALGQVGSVDIMPDLLQALFYENELEGYISIAVAIGKIGGELALVTLIQTLEDGDTDSRVKAVYTLGEIGNKIAIPSLIQTLENEQNFVFIRSDAAKALGQIKSYNAIPALIKALDDSNATIRSSAAAALGKIASSTSIYALIQTIKDSNYNVRREAAYALGEIGDKSVIPILIEVLGNEVSAIIYNKSELNNKEQLTELESQLEAISKSQHKLKQEMLNNEGRIVQLSVIRALGKLGSETAIPALIKLLEENKFNNFIIHSLGQIGSKKVLPILLRNLKHEDANIRASAAFAIGQIGGEDSQLELLEALHDENIDVIKNAVYALGKIENCELLISLVRLLSKITIGDVINKTLSEIYRLQKRCKYYNYSLAHSDSKEIFITSNNELTVYIRLMHILHLSDLHFGTLDQAKLWSNQLATDLRNELEIPQLDALILSGDIANKSTSDEYAAAKQFLDELRQDFALKPEQIIIVPGNHDLNWQIAQDAHTAYRRERYQGKLDQEIYIDDGGNYIEVADKEKYKQRFEHFSNFYQTIKNQPYPLDYDQQYTLDHFPNQNLLILGLNSAWQLDHHYKSRASIKINALTKALTEIRRNQDYQNCIKIAVWHHPLDSASEDRIKDESFMEQLAVAGFRFFLHGHVHQAQKSFYEYDAERGLFRICAGTFGAPTHELTTAEPWQYHLLKLENNTLTVRSRKRKTENGAWEADNCWRQGKGKGSLDSYTITWQ